MTERKAFKARVRARMDETGQTYAQAAAILEAGNPARSADTHPASALVVALLRTHGVDLAPAAAFGIGGGIGFMYGLFSYAEVGHPLLTIVCQHHPAPWAPSILDRLRVPYASATTKSATASLLRDRRPVILPIARGDVAWLETSVDEREDHVVLVIPEQGGCRILDGSGASASMQPDEVLAAYMRSRRKHPAIALDGAAGARMDVSSALVAGLRACLAGMTEPVLGNSFDVNFGLSGLTKWARLADAAGKDGWPKLFGQNDVWRGRLVDGIEREHTAPTAGRPLFVQTLRLARTLGSEGVGSAAQAFEQSGHHWRAISHRAASGSLTYEQLARGVRNIVEVETGGLEVLADALR
jgi:hypothetical protein